jgi:hypothetical protein
MSKLKKLVTVFSVLALVAALAAPALAKPGKGHGNGKAKAKKGKRAIGVVTAFDAVTGALAVELRNGDLFAGVVDPDAKIKLEHRGKPSKKGNPTKGSFEDITAGDKVLKMKIDEDSGLVDKLHLRQSDSTVVDAPGGEGDDPDESEEDIDLGDGTTDEGGTTDPGDGTTDEGGTTDPVCVDDPLTPLVNECDLPALP